MSVNISKMRRDELLIKLEGLKTYIEEQEENEKKEDCLKSLDELAEMVERQPFGLVFEEHREKIQEELETGHACFIEEKELRIERGGGTEHFLIEGENLTALTLLLETHREKIDLCIIDPPYNRGKNDFIYDDDYVDPNDTFIHSKWASFMHARLVLARELLSPKGYICLNIDDNELATLKLICDQIFGAKNFVGMYMWEKTSTAPALSKKIRKKLEYVLCYAKKLDKKHQFSQGMIEGGDAPLLNRGNPFKRLVFPAGSVRFQIEDGVYEDSDDKKIRLEQPVRVEGGVNVTPLVAIGEYKWVQETLDREIEKGTYFLVKSSKFSIRYQRMGMVIHKTPQNLLNGKLGVGTNEEAKKELRSLGLPIFDYPKPTSLYTFLIDMVNLDKDITVLDFFAGSGTTGHAVMKKNHQDGGRRQFILCTDNQENACRAITYERLSRAIDDEGFWCSLTYLKAKLYESPDEVPEDEEFVWPR